MKLYLKLFGLALFYLLTLTMSGASIAAGIDGVKWGWINALIWITCSFFVIDWIDQVRP